MDAPKDAAPPSNEDNYIAYAIAPIGSSPLNSSPSKKHGSFRQESEPRHGKWHINGVGQVIFKEHNGYTLMVQIQLGIRTSVSQIMPRKNRELQLSDINYVLKLDFPNKGSLKTPPHKQPHFLFYDYAPMAFRHLRDRFGISPTHYLTSLCHDKSLSILGTPGKSGALFFFSADMQYIIKTVTKAESKFLRKILPQYYNHVMSNPSTLITRFYGLHSIKPIIGRNVRFIVMNNVFDSKLYVGERYDLKGSTIGRSASEREKQRDAPILKDNDFLSKKRKILVSQEMKDKIMTQLKKDCAWLESIKIMDYSLLLGAHSVKEEDHDVLSPSSALLLLQDTLSETSISVQKDSPEISTTVSDTTQVVETTIELEVNHVEIEFAPATEPIPVIQTIPASPTEKQNTTKPTQPAQPPDISTNHADKPTTSTSTSMTTSTNPTPSTRRSTLNLLQLFRNNSETILEKQFQGEKVSEFQRYYGGIMSEKLDEQGNREIYFIGIIDLLQQWNNKKQLENIFKGLTNDKKKISAVSPKLYAHRFIQFLEEALVVEKM